MQWANNPYGRVVRQSVHMVVTSPWFFYVTDMLEIPLTHISKKAKKPRE
jgi:hypothetical protein